MEAQVYPGKRFYRIWLLGGHGKHAASRNTIFCRPFSTSNPADRVFFQQGATR
jgi:hypothetical protein